MCVLSETWLLSEIWVITHIYDGVGPAGRAGSFEFLVSKEWTLLVCGF